MTRQSGIAENPISNPPAVLSWRVQLAYLLTYLLCAVVMTYPLVLRLGDTLPAGADPLKHTWRIGWEAHKLTTAPLELYQANSFYLYPDSFAYDDLMLTPGLMGLPIALASGNVVLAHNLAILASLVLSGFTMFLYAYHLTRNPLAAWLAGLIFGFSTFRLGHYPHINLLAVQWLPLFFLGLDKLLKVNRLRLVLLTAAAGFLQALSSLMVMYLMLLMTIPYLVLSLGWNRPVRLRNLRGIIAALGITSALVLPFALPYYRVAQSQNFARDPATIQALSATLSSYLSVPPENWLLGRALARFAHIGNYPHEHWLFPGFIAVSLALVGIFFARRAWRARVLLVVISLAALFSFGPELYLSATQKVTLPFELPYGWLYDILPGFASLRAGSRFALIVMFGLAGLAALGARGLLARFSPRVQLGLAAGCGALLLIENGIAPISLQAIPVDDNVPPVYRWLAAQTPDSAIAELPIGAGRAREQQLGLYQYLSIYHWQPLLTAAFFSYYPEDYRYLVGFVARFPAPDALALLREFKVRYVLVHWKSMSPSERAALRAQLAAARLTPLQQFQDDAVFEVPRGDQDLGALRVEFFSPSPIPPDAAPTLYALVSNPTPALYFFNPQRRLAAVADARTLTLPLPLFLESGTHIASTQLPDAGAVLRVTPAADTTLAFAPYERQIQREPGSRAPRLIALEWLNGDILAKAAQTRVVLRWRVRDRIREPYEVELVARDASGGIRSRAAAFHPAPANPTARWRPGELLEDTLVLDFPARGDSPIILEIRLYEPVTQQPLLPLDRFGSPLERMQLSFPSQ